MDKINVIALELLIILLLLLIPNSNLMSDGSNLKYEPSLFDGNLAQNSNFLKGVNEILISQDSVDFLAKNNSCVKGDVLGAYFNGTIVIRDGGLEANRHTLSHEIGHNAWKKMNNSRRAEWTALYANTENFITKYSKVSPNEDFAENFACYFVNFDNCTTKMELKKKLFVGKVVNEINGK